MSSTNSHATRQSGGEGGTGENRIGEWAAYEDEMRKRTKKKKDTECTDMSSRHQVAWPSTCTES